MCHSLGILCVNGWFHRFYYQQSFDSDLEYANKHGKPTEIYSEVIYHLVT